MAQQALAGFRQFVALIAAAVLLTSCASWEYDRAREMEPAGTPFTRALYDAYLAKSAQAYEEDNQALSDAFALRAIAAAEGTVVAPVVPEAGALVSVSASVTEFDEARARLMNALVAGREAAPVPAAQAQVAFDCWYLRTIDPESTLDQALACRSEFLSLIGALEAAIAPPQPAEPAPVVPEPARFTVYFGFDEWFLRAEALQVIDQAMETARAGGHQEIILSGHADRAGPAEYNQRLSLRRAEAVKATMVELGALPEAIRVYAYGETRPAVPTPDGVPEPLNRRVEIDLVP